MEVQHMAVSSFTIKLSSIFGVSLVIFLLDWFYMAYLTSKGLDLKAQALAFSGMNLSLPLQWLPVLGIVLVSLVTWYEAYYRIFPRRGIEIDPLGRMHLVRAVVFSVTMFVLILYLPALVGSDWFWTAMSNASNSMTQVRDFGNSLLAGAGSPMRLDLIWQYSLSQVVAAAVMVFGALVLGRAARRVRK
jgi:hypothetical protein